MLVHMRIDRPRYRRYEKSWQKVKMDETGRNDRSGIRASFKRHFCICITTPTDGFELIRAPNTTEFDIVMHIL